MIQRRFTTLLRTAGMAAAVALVAAACSGGGGTTTQEPTQSDTSTTGEEPGGETSAPSGDLEVVRVGLGPFLSFSGMWTAIELGYFEEQGIEVEVSSFLDGSMAVPPLVAGELEVAGLTMSAGLFNTLSRDAEFRLVIDGAQERENSGIVALNVRQDLYDGGIQGIEDLAGLKGKRIGVTALGSINQYATARALEQAGVDPQNDVEWVIGIPQPDMIGALGAGQLDAANFAVDLAAGAETAGSGPVTVRGYEGAPGMQGTAFAMSNKFIEEDRDLAERFAMALVKGIEKYRAAHEDPDAHPEVLEAVAAHTNIQTAERLRDLHPWWPWIAPEGRLNSESIMEQQDYWADVFDMVDTKVDESTVIDNSVLDAALARLGE